MASDWQALTKLTRGAPLQVERVRIPSTGIAIEGQFDLPPLAQLPAEDQVFVAAFVRCHGSIKQMEQYFGVSYPTIKNRLNRIGALLPFAEIDPASDAASDAGARSMKHLLSGLELGTLSVDDVIRQLRKPEDKS
jgi:hypothetical protein